MPPSYGWWISSVRTPCCPAIGAALDAILNHAGAEYMDCYNAGIPADVWLAAGFTERIEGDGCIIPNYLTPPLHENTEYYYFTNKPESFVMFKADGDQIDRI